MHLREKVEAEINRLVDFLTSRQGSEGAWHFCFETGPLTDAYMIILLRTLEHEDEEFIQLLAKRLVSKQASNGAWKLFHDEAGGNLSATVEAYMGLLYSGYLQKEDEQMKQAEQFIRDRGGFADCAMHTKFMLAVTGQYPWPPFFLPVELVLLPRFFPIHFFDFVGYSRVHLAPMLILSDRRFVSKVKQTPDLSYLNLERSVRAKKRPNAETEMLQDLPLFKLIKQMEKYFGFLPKQVHKLALRKAERFMLERIEPDGTLYSYFSATYLMVLSLLALGYRKIDPVIVKSIQGLKTFLCQADHQVHLQNSTSTVWDTALISHALQTAGLAQTTPTIAKANRYLLSRQQHQYADWSINNPGVPPGCWGFSNINTRNPDVDDTTAVLRAIKPLVDSSLWPGLASRGGLGVINAES